MYFILLVLLLIIVFTLLYNLLSFNDNYKYIIEGFDSNDVKFKDLLNNYINSSNSVHSYNDIIPSLNDIQTALQLTISKQNSQNNYQAQQASYRTECIYNAIIKFLHDNSLNIDDGGNGMYDNLTSSRKNLFDYMDGQITNIRNLNNQNMENLANSKQKLDDLNKQLEKTEKPNHDAIDKLKQRINNEYDKLQKISQSSGPNDAFSNGLYFHIVDGYYNDNTSYFINANPRKTTTTVKSSNSSGYTNDFSGTIQALVPLNGAHLKDSETHNYSVEWIGYFYTKSNAPKGTVENWQFRVSSDNAAYLWLGDNAKGNGKDIVNYNVNNATVNNGGNISWSALDWIDPIQLRANTYYPIRIQYGNAWAGDGINIRFKNNGQQNSGGVEVTNGIGYYFSNGNNPLDNADKNPNYVSGGLFFTVYNGYFGNNENCFYTKGGKPCNDNTNFFLNNNNYFEIGGDNIIILSNGPSDGVTNSIDNIASGTTTKIGEKVYNIPIDNGNSSWHYFSVEWIGFFYTKSKSTGTDLEPWNFSIESDDASFLWIGDNAKGNGQAPVNYKTNNAISNGGVHGNTEKNETVNLLPNRYYPIRIQFGENGGVYNMKLKFTPPNGNPTTDGTGYFFSNKSNPFNNTGGFDTDEYNKLQNSYKDDSIMLAALENAYNKAYTEYQNLKTQISSTETEYNNFLNAANQSSADLINSGNFVNSVKKAIDDDYSSVQNIFDNIKTVTNHKYTDMFNKIYTGLIAYVIEAKEVCAKVIAVEASQDSKCKTNALDGDNNKMNSFYFDGYCYYTRPDSKLVNVVNPGSTNNISQINAEGGFTFNCDYNIAKTQNNITLNY